MKVILSALKIVLLIVWTILKYLFWLWLIGFEVFAGLYLGQGISSTLAKVVYGFAVGVCIGATVLLGIKATSWEID